MNVGMIKLFLSPWSPPDPQAAPQIQTACRHLAHNVPIPAIGLHDPGLFHDLTLWLPTAPLSPAVDLLLHHREARSTPLLTSPSPFLSSVCFQTSSGLRSVDPTIFRVENLSSGSFLLYLIQFPAFQPLPCQPLTPATPGAASLASWFPGQGRPPYLVSPPTC